MDVDSQCCLHSHLRFGITFHCGSRLCLLWCVISVPWRLLPFYYIVKPKDWPDPSNFVWNSPTQSSNLCISICSSHIKSLITRSSDVRFRAKMECGEWKQGYRKMNELKLLFCITGDIHWDQSKYQVTEGERGRKREFGSESRATEQMCGGKENKEWDGKKTGWGSLQ